MKISQLLMGVAFLVVSNLAFAEQSSVVHEGDINDGINAKLYSLLETAATANPGLGINKLNGNNPAGFMFSISEVQDGKTVVVTLQCYKGANKTWCSLVDNHY